MGFLIWTFGFLSSLILEQSYFLRYMHSNITFIRIYICLYDIQNPILLNGDDIKQLRSWTWNSDIPNDKWYDKIYNPHIYEY